MIAPPSFFVLYFDKPDAPDVQVVRLTDHYTENPSKNSMELVVNVYNICYSENREILKRSRNLREYSKFIWLVNKYLDERMSLEKAVEATVREEKEEGILVDFLNRYATEVEGMLKGITVEEYGRVMKREGFDDGKAEGIEQGRTEGKAEGEASKAREMAEAMKSKNYSIDEISELTGLSVDEIEKL